MKNFLIVKNISIIYDYLVIYILKLKLNSEFIFALDHTIKRYIILLLHNYFLFYHYFYSQKFLYKIQSKFFTIMNDS